MKRIACSVLASLLLLSACGSDKTTTPAAAPAKPAANPAAAPAENPKLPAASPKPPAENPKLPAASPKPQAENPKLPAENPKLPAENPTPQAENPKLPAASPKPPANADMDADAKALMAKPEQPVEKIEIQHILISFKGAPRMPASVTRSKDEAQALAQKVYAEVIGGGDFDALLKQYTNDSAPGIYPLTKATRGGMVKSFGDVGWRLKVGEIGVGVWDATASPFGWHIIKRLK